MHRQILRIALPAIVTNITVPLLGLVDTAIVGHMGTASYIGAVAVGSMIFNLVYWLFGFLRMGTSGLTAQAYGRRDEQAISWQLSSSLLQAGVIAMAIVLLQRPLRQLMLLVVGPTPDVLPLTVTYYNIVVWGAPAVMGLYALTGWFIGMQDTRRPMVVSIVQNVVNIAASLLLVYGFSMKIEGVAIGTVTAQYAGFGLALALVGRRHALMVGFREVLRRAWSEVGRMFSLNASLFFRTLCLVAVNLFFTAAGARQGAVVLAVNTLLMQLYLLFSYVMDGFAYAGEALGGRYWGADDMAQFRRLVRTLFGWGLAVAALFTMVYAVGGEPFLSLLTDESSVVRASRNYILWACFIPFAGMAAFVWDGIFVGVTASAGMLLSSVIGAACFFTAAWLLMPQWGNHGLWVAMLLFLVVRGLVQTVLYIVKRDKPSLNGKHISSSCR